MRVACLQFAPQVGDIENNLNRADSVLQKSVVEDLDLLVLPELAFTGYNFKSLQDITPFLEPSGSGISSLWARTMALKYNCTVAVGYPEKADVTPKWPTGPEFYNSMIVVNGDGETIANYRKSFLFHTDETWALEGQDGFYEGFIPGLGYTTIGICMDINPYKFEAAWEKFEFATHIQKVESNLVIISMSWMTREDTRHFSRMPDEPDMETLSYWVSRFEPLIRSENKEEVIVVFCNRTGTEDNATYSGTSTILGIQEGEVKVYGLLGRGSKELLVVDTTNPPYAKLAHRPAELDEEATSPATTKQPSSNLHSEKPSQQEPSAPVLSTSLVPTMAAMDPAKATTSPENKARKPTPRPTNGYAEIQSPLKNGPPEPITIPPSVADGGIPTPSAPSPVPMVLRPKLVIPRSPQPTPSTFSSSLPASALSQKSQQSVMSDESTQTIRSNPRPPEDSTPYPRSGYSWNRNNSKFQSPAEIYSGNVSIRELSAAGPITPFDGMSPISALWYQKSTDALWDRYAAAAQANQKLNDILEKKSPTPGPLSSTPMQLDTIVAQASVNEQPSRPSSPKSRNASRSRLHERSHSALSLNRPQRPPSTTGDKSRKATPGDQMLISNGANSDNQRAQNIATPAAFEYYRQARNFQRSSSFSGRTAALSAWSPEPEARPPSRGRQPEASPWSVSKSEDKGKNQATENHERSTSADSTQNDILHSRQSRRDKPSGSNHTDRKSSRNKQRGSSRDQSNHNFERVEAIVHPSCPLHGNGSETAHRTSPAVPRKSQETSTSDPEQSTSTAMDVDSNLNDAISFQRSTTAPPHFNPPTPTAMSFEHNMDDPGVAA